MYIGDDTKQLSESELLKKILLISVKHRIQRGVVVHLHLAVYLHVFTSGSDVFEQLPDRCGHILILLVEYIQLCLAFCTVLLVDIGALHLLLHVVYLERED